MPQLQILCCKSLNFSVFKNWLLALVHKKCMIFLLSFLPHGRFVTPEELDSLSAYLKDKRARLLRSTADPLAGKREKLLIMNKFLLLKKSLTLY